MYKIILFTSNLQLLAQFKHFASIGGNEINIIHAPTFQQGIQLKNDHKSDILCYDNELVNDSGFAIADIVPRDKIILVELFPENPLLMNFCRNEGLLGYHIPLTQQTFDDMMERIEKLMVIRTLKNWTNHLESPKISVIVQNLIVSVEVNSIVYIQVDRSTTSIYTEDGRTYCSFHSFAEYMELLKDYPFFRISRSELVNLDKIKHFDPRQKTDNLVMKGNATLTVSKYFKAAFREVIDGNIF